MSYKTLVVHLNDQRRVEGLLRTALPIARRTNAHVIGIFVLPPPIVITDIGASYGAQVVAIERERLEAEAEQVRRKFEEATAGQPVVAEWRLVESGSADISEALIDHCRTADLIVASQTDPESDLSPLLDAPQRLALESGRPVLIVPYAGRFDTVGERVLVAWNNRREASRAVFDAMPLLNDAKEVRVVWINPQKDGVEPSQLPTAEIAATLARHGVKVVSAYSVAPEIDVGNELLSRAADEGADLIVMGCYGHSRLREFVFGGATRTILNHMTVPVLMSH